MLYQLKNQELFALRQRASIGLVTWTNENLSTKFAAPTKLYDYISEGMYVVSFPNYSMTNLNNKYNELNKKIDNFYKDFD